LAKINRWSLREENKYAPQLLGRVSLSKRRHPGGFDKYNPGKSAKFHVPAPIFAANIPQNRAGIIIGCMSAFYK
jgi:hypothetical protein